MQDPGVGRAALRACATELRAYEACAGVALTPEQRALTAAPQLYVARATADALEAGRVAGASSPGSGAKR